jgi:hypothetical protein
LNFSEIDHVCTEHLDRRAALTLDHRRSESYLTMGVAAEDRADVAGRRAVYERV